MNIKMFNDNSFGSIATAVQTICDTENSYEVGELSGDVEKRLCDFESYSDYGFKSMGRLVGFPAPFVKTVAETNPDLASKIVNDRINAYFSRTDTPFVVREFNDKVAGVVSDKYAYFDDNEVIDIIKTSPLAEMKYQNIIVTPERLHLRAIDSESFKVDGDDSPMFFSYFVDNSMVGGAAFKVRLGIYRQVCTNGLIIPAKEFTLCKQVHRGTKDIGEEFNRNVALLSEKKDAVIEALNKSANTESAIEKLEEEFKNDYLAKRLNASKVEAEKILNLYTLTYGGKTKWALSQAITEFARDISDINRREMLEARALRIA